MASSEVRTYTVRKVGRLGRISESPYTSSSHADFWRMANTWYTRLANRSVSLLGSDGEEIITCEYI